LKVSTAPSELPTDTTCLSSPVHTACFTGPECPTHLQGGKEEEEEEERSKRERERERESRVSGH
jgi:hypothetical protein